MLNDDINQMERFLNGGANSILQVLCSSIMVGAVFFALAPKLALISLLPVPLILYGTFWFQKRLAPRYAAVREAAGVINGRLNNNLLGVATIKAFTAEEFEAEHIRAASDHYRNSNARAIRLSAAITPVIRMAILAGFVATLVYGGWMATHGEIGVGSYSVLVYLTQRLLWPLTGLADIADLYQRSMASIERVLNVLATPLTIPYEGAHLPDGSVAGALAIDNLSFAYGATATLKNVSLTVGAGETVAFVGATGSGKSTLVKLLLRFFTSRHRARSGSMARISSSSICPTCGATSVTSARTYFFDRRHDRRQYRLWCQRRPARSGDRGGARRRGARLHRKTGARL
ncbi:ABC transporter transmembrane domain-containing protein [Undibacterium arcticum]